MNFTMNYANFWVLKGAIKMSKDNLGDRMKTYEYAILIKETLIIINR